MARRRGRGGRGAARQGAGVLSGFKDVWAADASVVKVHDALRDIGKGTRKNSAPAALKVHAWIRVFTGELLKYRITADAHGDSRAFGVTHNLRGVLILLDQAYSSYSLWRRIDQVGGYFRTRLPKDRNPELVADLRRHRGQARKAKGRRLRDLLDGLQRRVLDVMGGFRCHVRKYGTTTGSYEQESFRIVGIRHPKTGCYHLYATNVPPELLPADHVRQVYRLRWEIETFLKTTKSGAGLDELPSSKRHIVETLVYASLLRATSAMQALAHFQLVVAQPHGLHINPMMWMRWSNRQHHQMLEHALRRFEQTLSSVQLARLLADPNLSARPPNRAQFVLARFFA